MITIANPIYDVVFKYLMDDERVARIILSALLKKNIVKVEMRPHEYAGDKNASIALYRIDFGATVLNADGTEHLILIELQKTWLETETLRFRQYLGLQYENPRNMKEESRGAYALPMVAVYLLGHRVGDIEEPVVYIQHEVSDYDGRPVTKGVPDPFIDSLTHESIIVQIPLLRGRLKETDKTHREGKSRLDMLLSIFDQTQKDENDHKVLKIDDSLYEGDVDMEHVVGRLVKAAASMEMRRKINIEEEFMSAIEHRDAEILTRDYELAQKTVQLKEKSVQLEEKSVQLEEKSAQLEEKSAQLEEKSAQLKEKSAQLEEKNTQLKEQSAQLEEQSAQLEEQSAQLEEQSAQLEEQSAQLEEQSAMLRKSVQMLHKASLSAEAIATQLGMDVEKVRHLLAT